MVGGCWGIEFARGVWMKVTGRETQPESNIKIKTTVYINREACCVSLCEQQFAGHHFVI